MTEAKLETARQMGATDTVNAAEVDDVVTAVKDMTGGGVEYSFEAIGLATTVQQAFNMLDIGGTATVIGMVPSKTRVELRGIDFLSEKKLQGSMMGSNQFRSDIPMMIDLLSRRSPHARRDDLGTHRPRPDQRGLRLDEGRRGHPHRRHLRLRERPSCEARRAPRL